MHLPAAVLPSAVVSVASPVCPLAGPWAKLPDSLRIRPASSFPSVSPKASLAASASTFNKGANSIRGRGRAPSLNARIRPITAADSDGVPGDGDSENVYNDDQDDVEYYYYDYAQDYPEGYSADNEDEGQTSEYVDPEDVVPRTSDAELDEYTRRCIDRTEPPFEVFALIGNRAGKVYDFYQNSIEDIASSLYTNLARDIKGGESVQSMSSVRPLDGLFTQPKTQVRRFDWDPYTKTTVRGCYSDVPGYAFTGWQVRNALIESVKTVLTKYRDDAGVPDFRVDGIKPIGYLPADITIAAYNVCTGEDGPKLYISNEAMNFPKSLGNSKEPNGCVSFKGVEAITSPMMGIKQVKGLGYTSKVPGFNVPIRVLCV